MINETHIYVDLVSMSLGSEGQMLDDVWITKIRHAISVKSAIQEMLSRHGSYTDKMLQKIHRKQLRLSGIKI